ncbi:hypothetical protein [Dickeya aquatica]|uniref:hypothetical protein n=1 Tax=Dickeya aquatica TaxID=1401087 RepID=UPI0003A2FE64|nr:hypothetical protein [Dickeya aquatica]
MCITFGLPWYAVKIHAQGTHYPVSIAANADREAFLPQLSRFIEVRCALIANNAAEIPAYIAPCRDDDINIIGY